MNYSIVLATRNRRSALELSIPLMLKQGYPPSEFILIDSSDSHQTIVKAVETIFAELGPKIALTILESKPGTSLQRNLGLEHVRSEIVMFPDDDALWYPGYAEAVMRIYARDKDQLIGGVAGNEANEPPSGALLEARRPFSMSFRDKISLFISKRLRWLDLFTFMREPAFLEGNAKSVGKDAPGWLADENALLVGIMTGFTMSFRTSSIIANRFDEALGRYALFEDYDVSLRVMDKQIIVKARNAKVFHYRSPESRTNGFDWGVINILNRAYIICKSSRPGSLARRHLITYSFYKCMRYLSQYNTAYGRQRFKGSLYAFRHIRSLVTCPPERLTGTYIDARDKCLSKHVTN